MPTQLSNRNGDSTLTKIKNQSLDKCKMTKKGANVCNKLVDCKFSKCGKEILHGKDAFITDAEQKACTLPDFIKSLKCSDKIAQTKRILVSRANKNKCFDTHCAQETDEYDTIMGPLITKASNKLRKCHASKCKKEELASKSASGTEEERKSCKSKDITKYLN